MNPIDLLGLTLVHFVWQGTAIGVACAVVSSWVRHKTPQVRYLVSCAALSAMLAAPLATGLALTRPAVFSPSGIVAKAGVAHASLDTAPSRAERRAVAAPAAAPTDIETPSWLGIIAFGWLAGVAVLLARFAAAWRSVRRLHHAALVARSSQWVQAAGRLALRLGVRRTPHVVDSIDVDTPTVAGWWQPVILLPIAALANLTPTQVEAILAHELAHIRRHDCLVNLAQILAETVLFYHPAVWWVSARIRTEREHCCDEVAASACGDAVGYAEALVELERWRTERAMLALAATGAPLVARIRRLLGAPHDAPRSSAVMTLAGVVGIILCLAGATHYLRAQADPHAPASTQVDPDEAKAWHMVFSHEDSEMRFIGYSGRDLVRFAYQVPAARVAGGPSWMDEEILRLVVNLDAAPRADEMADVVRRVLEERLHLRTHLEQRNFPVFALELAHSDGRLGPNISPSTIDCFDVAEWVAAGQPPRQLPPAVPRQPVCGEELPETPVAHNVYIAITMPQLAEQLRHSLGWGLAPRRRPADIVDRTGLAGRYDVELTSFAPAAALMARYPPLTNLFEPLGLNSLPHALEAQLGLRLVESEAPFDVIVIDSAERPTP